MALTAGSALIGGIAVGTGTVAATTAGVAALAIGAVGAITGNKTLAKIGGGLGLGTGAASLLSDATNAPTAATTVGSDAASAATTGADTSSIADSVNAGADGDLAAGDVAAGDVAEDPLDVAGAAAGSVSVNPLDTADADGLFGSDSSGLVDSASSVAPNVDADLNSVTNPTSANSINANLSTDTSPGAAQNVASTTTTPPAQSAQPANSISSNLTAPAQAPGSQAPIPTGGTNVAQTGAPQLTPPSSFFGQISNWFGNLDGKEKLVVGQIGAGLVQGIGGGALSMISSDQKLALEKQAQDFQENNMSGAASVPKVNVKPNPNANPYSSTTTPIYDGPTPAATQGLVNSAKVQ